LPPLSSSLSLSVSTYLPLSRFLHPLPSSWHSLATDHGCQTVNTTRPSIWWNSKRRRRGQSGRQRIERKAKRSWSSATRSCWSSRTSAFPLDRQWKLPVKLQHLRQQEKGEIQAPSSGASLKHLSR
jgi:hypothetical protein